MIAILPFKKITVNIEQSSQKLTADRKRINITLLKKTQILASCGCLRLPVFNYGLHNDHYPLLSTGDVQEKLPALNWEILDNYRSIKSLTLHFHIRIFVWNFIFLFQISYYFTATFTSEIMKQSNVSSGRRRQ